MQRQTFNSEPKYSQKQALREQRNRTNRKTNCKEQKTVEKQLNS